MVEERCEMSQCEAAARTHLIRVKCRAIHSQGHWCAFHGNSQLSDFYTQTEHEVGDGAAGALDGASCFDVEFLLMYQESERYWIGLKQLGEVSRFPISVGYPEFAALYYSLEGGLRSRPLTHQAMAEACKSLGGRIEYVAINHFDAAAKVLHAKLNLSQNKKTISVDVRASDGCILAVEATVPIFVYDSVLTELRRLGSALWE